MILVPASHKRSGALAAGRHCAVSFLASREVPYIAALFLTVLDQRLCSKISVSLFIQFFAVFQHLTQDVQMHAAVSGLLRRYFHVFNKVLHKEPRSIIPRQDFGADSIQLSAARGSCRHRGQQHLQAQFFRFGVGQRLTYAGQDPGDHDLVCDLGMLSLSRLALIIQVCPHSLKQRKAGLVILLFAAH